METLKYRNISRVAEWSLTVGDGNCDVQHYLNINVKIEEEALISIVNNSSSSSGHVGPTWYQYPSIRNFFIHVLLLSGIHLRPSDVGCQYSRSIYTARFMVWQPRRAADTSTNWRQSLFCCCTASMEQATDRAETAASDGLVSSWSENISVSFCLRAPRYGLTVMRPRSSSRGRNTSASVTVTVTVTLQSVDIKAVHFAQIFAFLFMLLLTVDAVTRSVDIEKEPKRCQCRERMFRLFLLRKENGRVLHSFLSLLVNVAVRIYVF